MRGGGKEEVKETNDIKSHRRDGATPYKYTSFFFPKINKPFDATSRALVLDFNFCCNGSESLHTFDEKL